MARFTKRRHSTKRNAAPLESPRISLRFDGYHATVQVNTEKKHSPGPEVVWLITYSVQNYDQVLEGIYSLIEKNRTFCIQYKL
jgi:hypothetical protein